MNQFKITTVMVGLLSVCLAPSMRADGFNKETHFTISQPLQVRNTLLAPGQYMLKLTEADVDHVIVSIYNADGTRLEGIVMGFSAYRADAGDKKMITASQPQGNQPSTLKSWFYPGENYGVEFPVNDLTSEARRALSSNGHAVQPKAKGQTVAAAADGSSNRE